MQHISLTPALDLVPLRCPKCKQLVCERVSRLKSDRQAVCRSCNAPASLDDLIAGDPALGRILSMHHEVGILQRTV